MSRPSTRGCKCKDDSDPCPLEGQCLMKSVVYKATVTTNQPKLKRKTYYGMTGGTFKKRYYGHKSDFEHKDKYGTTLSRYIWKLKDIKSNMSENAKKGFKWDINWEIQQSAPAYKPGSKDCKLCTAEKYYILNEVDSVSLNVRSELLSKCRHKAKWKLKKLLS